jgi:thioredoxin 1
VTWAKNGKEAKMSTVAEVRGDNFQNEVMEAAGPVLVDFWAEWCPPCKMLSPIVDRVAEKLEGQLKIVKCNVDESPEIASRFGVRGIPKLIFFTHGQVIEQATGLMSESQLMAKAAAVLKS